MVLTMPFCRKTKSPLRSGTVRSYTSRIESAPVYPCLFKGTYLANKPVALFRRGVVLPGYAQHTCADKDRRVGWAVESDTTRAGRGMEGALLTEPRVSHPQTRTYAQARLTCSRSANRTIAEPMRPDAPTISPSAMRFQFANFGLCNGIRCSYAHKCSAPRSFTDSGAAGEFLSHTQRAEEEGAPDAA